VDTNYTDFGPRIGLAYALTADGKTAVRGGYALIYPSPTPTDAWYDAPNSLGFEAVTTFVSSRGGNYSVFKLSEGPSTLIQPAGAGGGPTAFRGQNVSVQVRQAPSPYLQQFNLTIQREIPGQLALSASYTGNRGVKLGGANYDLNQLDPKYYSMGLTLQDQVTNPFYGQIVTGGLSGRTISRSRLLVPLADYDSVSTLANHGASSTYHALQVTAEKRYAKGISVLVSYTNSKTINDSSTSAGSEASTFGTGFRIGRLNRRLDRAIDEDDISQRLNVSGVFELPFGKGKRFLGNVHGVADYVVSGWHVNTITAIQTGQPLMVRGANNFTLNWPDMVNNPTLHGEERGVKRWFDTSAFRSPPNLVIGNAPRTLPDTRGPGMFNMSLSVFKNFRVREGKELSFRAEAFNAINHVNLNNPGVTFTPNGQGLNTNAAFGSSLVRCLRAPFSSG
jgi:hypothetical protein